MANLTYGEVTKILLDAVPEISEVCAAESLKWELRTIPPHIVYGSIFSDFLRRVVVEDTRSIEVSCSDVIRRSFELIEKLAQSEV